MNDTELTALADAIDAISTLSWHPQPDANEGAELGEEELFSKADRERARIW
jgi:hypothetical protein